MFRTFKSQVKGMYSEFQVTLHAKTAIPHFQRNPLIFIILNPIKIGLSCPIVLFLKNPKISFLKVYFGGTRVTRPFIQNIDFSLNPFPSSGNPFHSFHLYYFKFSGNQKTIKLLSSFSFLLNKNLINNLFGMYVYTLLV